MTTVVIDFKNRIIAADKQTTCNMLDFKGTTINEQIWYETCKKIKLLDNGVYFVGSGNVRELTRQWNQLYFNGRIDKDVKANCTIAVVRAKGDGLFVDLYEYTTVRNYLGQKVGKFNRTTLQGTTNVITFGSGGTYAYGAFMAGCTAEQSVVVASKCDPYTSYEVDVVEVIKQEEEEG